MQIIPLNTLFNLSFSSWNIHSPLIFYQCHLNVYHLELWLCLPFAVLSHTVLSTSLPELHDLKNSNQPSLSPGLGTFLSTKEIKYWAVISENETWITMAEHENAEGPWITRFFSLNHSHFTRPSMYSVPKGTTRPTAFNTAPSLLHSLLIWMISGWFKPQLLQTLYNSAVADCHSGKRKKAAWACFFIYLMYPH